MRLDAALVPPVHLNRRDLRRLLEVVLHPLRRAEVVPPGVADDLQVAKLCAESLQVLSRRCFVKKSNLKFR